MQRFSSKKIEVSPYILFDELSLTLEILLGLKGFKQFGNDYVVSFSVVRLEIEFRIEGLLNDSH